MMKNNKAEAATFWVIFLVVALIGGIILIMGFDTVDASHKGVTVKFGEITGELNEGMHWTGLFTHTYVYDMRIRKTTVSMLDKLSSSTDKDGQIVYGKVAVTYRLKNNPTVNGQDGTVLSLYRNVGRDENIASTLLIEEIMKEGFKQATVEYEAIEILQNRQAVKELAKANIKNNFPEEYFEIVDITVSDIDFSEEFKQAIEEKKVASQDKLKEAEILEVVRLQQEQEILKYEAEAKKLELQKSQVTDQLNTQKMLEAWDGVLPQYLIITEGSQGMFLQLAQGELSTGTTGGDSGDEK